MAIDFYEDATNSSIPTDAVTKTISDLVEKQKYLADRVAALQVELNAAQEQFKQVSEKDLPEALLSAGVESITTKTGVKVTIKSNIYASISEANKERALSWLEEHGFGDVIKNQISLDFGRGEGDRFNDAAQALVEAGFTNEVNVKESVHPATLKALVKEQLEKGVEIPLELFGVYKQRVAVIK